MRKYVLYIILKQGTEMETTTPFEASDYTIALDLGAQRMRQMFNNDLSQVKVWYVKPFREEKPCGQPSGRSLLFG